ncbi:MAG: hypothetical protein IPL59_26655 [Candidatus Competibacteraceae bacterium]|nr:hypothetical protein [Candidatus Competibacteraceae bacterium]
MRHRVLIEALAVQLRELLARRGIAKPALVVFDTGGVWIAERLRHSSALPRHRPTGHCVLR